MGRQPADIGALTNATQLGFILGTLAFAVSGLADRFPASRIFAVCAVLGALPTPASPFSPAASMPASCGASPSASASPASTRSA